jgi:hypothetical protein
MRPPASLTVVAREKMIHEKDIKSKSSDTLPLLTQILLAENVKSKRTFIR